MSDYACLCVVCWIGNMSNMTWWNLKVAKGPWTSQEHGRGTVVCPRAELEGHNRGYSGIWEEIWWGPSFKQLLPAWHFASACISNCCVSVCVCLSHAGIVLKWLHGSSWLFAYRFSSTHATLCFMEIRVSPKIRVLPSGILSQILDWENFATTLTVSEQDINKQPHWLVVDSTWWWRWMQQSAVDWLALSPMPSCWWYSASSSVYNTVHIWPWHVVYPSVPTQQCHAVIQLRLFSWSVFTHAGVANAWVWW